MAKCKADHPPTPSALMLASESMRNRATDSCPCQQARCKGCSRIRIRIINTTTLNQLSDNFKMSIYTGMMQGHRASEILRCNRRSVFKKFSDSSQNFIARCTMQRNLDYLAFVVHGSQE